METFIGGFAFLLLPALIPLLDAIMQALVKRASSVSTKKV
jgi:hypothetical protein